MNIRHYTWWGQAWYRRKCLEIFLWNISWISLYQFFHCRHVAADLFISMVQYYIPANMPLLFQPEIMFLINTWVRCFQLRLRNWVRITDHYILSHFFMACLNWGISLMGWICWTVLYKLCQFCMKRSVNLKKTCWWISQHPSCLPHC